MKDFYSISFKNKLILFLSFFMLCFHNVTSENATQAAPHHILVTPSRLLVGSSNRICVSRLGSAVYGSANIQLELLTVGTSPLHVHRNTTQRQRFLARVRKLLPQGNGGCLELPVPRTPHRKVLLQFKMKLDSLPQYRVMEKKELYIQHDTNMIVIQTDKPIYRAGELVKFRVLQLKPDLTPLQMPIHRVSIETPPDIFGGPVKVVQWFNITTQLGIIQRDYHIDKYALQGEWRIVVDSRDPWLGSTVQPFRVTDYFLTPFYVTVHHEEEILSTLHEYTYNICARYLYGEFVTGRLTVTIRSDSYKSNFLYHEVNLDSGSGCYNYTVSTRSLGFFTEDVPKTIIAEVAMQEEGVRLWKNTTVTSRVVHNVVKIHYLPRQYTHYKAGLPIRLKAKVTDWKHRPVMNAKVQFCKHLNDQTEEVDNQEEGQISKVLYAPHTNGNTTVPQTVADKLIDECDTSSTDDRGYVSYLFLMGDEADVTHVRVKALVIDHPLHDLEPTDRRFPSASMLLQNFGNYSSDTIEIGHPLPNGGDLRIGSRQGFPIYMTTWDVRKITPITVHFLFITRSGNIYRWGTTIQCPIQILPSDVENPQSAFTSYDTTIYSNGTEECPGRMQYTSPTGLYKMTLPIRISHIMCPSSIVIAYYMSTNGDIITASRQFKVHECFHNKVYMQWSPSQIVPSSPTTLHLRTPTPSPSLCLLSALSRAFHHLPPQHQQHQMQHRVMLALNALMERRHNRTLSSMKRNVCFEDNSTTNITSVNKNSYEKMLNMFLSAGVEILTDTIPRRTECPDVEELIQKPADLYIPDANHGKDRTYFPETWLWDIHILDSKGRLDVLVNVPDEITYWDCEVYCLSRFGLAILSNRDSESLRVMQPFFVDLSTPRVVKRGEDAKMYYKVFNYMDVDIPISATLEVTPSAAATIANHQTGDKVMCLRRGQSIVSYFTVRGHQLKAVNVTVDVHVVHNVLNNCGKNNNITQNIRDKVVKAVMIEPEGYPMEKYKSALLCVDDLNNKTDHSWFMERVQCTQQSENWFISLVGDITGPMYMNMENLLNVPMGCGEQNMALLAYNFIALEYAMTGKRVANNVKERAVRNIASGYQRQLRYRHPAGGFSAFGPSDPSPSVWLTAFCVAYLPPMAERVEGLGGGRMDTRALTQAVQWLLTMQMENGCFRREGQVFHREMTGGLSDDASSVALTSFVIISLLDSKSPLVKPTVVQNSQYCLAALKYYHIDPKRYSALVNANKDRIYSLALAVLAQIKIEEYFKKLESKNEVMAEKRNLVKRQTKFEFYDQNYENTENHDFTEFLDDLDTDLYNDPFSKSNTSDRFTMGWGRNAQNENEAAKALHLAEKKKQVERDFLASGGAYALTVLKTFAQRAGDMLWWEADSLPVSIETTSYAMLGMLTVGGEENILDAMSAARWLSMHRTRRGGFISTQDTLLGIKALCSLRHMIPGIPPSLSVSVQAPGRGRQLDISPGERHKLHTVMVRSVDSIPRQGDAKLTVAVQGRGCVLVQVTQRYNAVSRSSESSPFRLLAKVTTDGTFSCQENNVACMCAAVLEVCSTWISASSFPEMAILEISLPTGYYADRTLLYKLIGRPHSLIRRIEESARGDKIVMYLATELQMGDVSECMNLYLVGPQTNTHPATIRVYDYYHTDVSYVLNYTIPKACDSNIQHPHEEPMDLIKKVNESTTTETVETNTDEDAEIVLEMNWEKVNMKASLVNEWSGDDMEMSDGFVNIQSDQSRIDTKLDKIEASIEKLDNSQQSEDLDGSGSDRHWDNVQTTESNLMDDMFTKDWHVIDTDMDLETPKTVEGVPPVFAMPPPSFNFSRSFI